MESLQGSSLIYERTTILNLRYKGNIAIVGERLKSGMLKIRYSVTFTQSLLQLACDSCVTDPHHGRAFLGGERR